MLLGLFVMKDLVPKWTTINTSVVISRIKLQTEKKQATTIEK
ncbi:hypothetical protein [Clostridium felsineum]|nr:hypothetical protein [Clostridium felsineum]